MPIHPPPDRDRDVARARLAADLVGFAAGLAAPVILSRVKGPRPVVAARQLVMYLLAQAFAMSLAHIAGAVGRDRSTVAHGMRLVEDRRENPAFDRWVESLEESLRAAPEPAPCDLPVDAPEMAP